MAARPSSIAWTSRNSSASSPADSSVILVRGLCALDPCTEPTAPVLRDLLQESGQAAKAWPSGDNQRSSPVSRACIRAFSQYNASRHASDATLRGPKQSLSPRRNPQLLQAQRTKDRNRRRILRTSSHLC